MATAAQTTIPVRPVLPTAEEKGHRWLPVIVAALAMVATLPGRTHGLGLITEPLLADLHLDRVDYAFINLWATLLGAVFCLPCGWLIDRIGSRIVLLGVTLGLGATVLGMGQATAGWGTLLVPGLFLLVMLTRGLGQSALSVVSLALMGRSVGRRAGLGVGVYSFVSALGFMAAFYTIKKVLETWEPGWRSLWSGIGAAVAIFGLLAFLVLRPAGPGRKETDPSAPSDNQTSDLTLRQTLRTSAFWVFAGATSLYGMAAAGISLFNQSILKERNFDRRIFLTITVLTPLVGLAANLTTGWLAGRVSLNRLLAGSMLILTTALLCFPLVVSLWQVYLYAVAMGIAGGMVTVIFFAAWGPGFGTTHLGKIQGAAQMLTVFASAGGPLLLAAGQRASGSYVPVFQGVALVTGLFAIAAWLVKLPCAGARPATHPIHRVPVAASAVEHPSYKMES